VARAYEVGRLDELGPGQRRVVTVGGIEIGVFNVGGTFYALPNLCVHQWGPLCVGNVSGTLACSAETNWRVEWVKEGQIVICPWHSLEFDLTTGQCLAYPRVKLRHYPVTVDDGIVKVHL
jgi:nitrite reductase/ring-hydroxylating ferredoxin subunit